MKHAEWATCYNIPGRERRLIIALAGIGIRGLGGRGEGRAPGGWCSPHPRSHVGPFDLSPNATPDTIRSDPTHTALPILAEGFELSMPATPGVSIASHDHLHVLAASIRPSIIDHRAARSARDCRSRRSPARHSVASTRCTTPPHHEHASVDPDVCLQGSVERYRSCAWRTRRSPWASIATFGCTASP